MKNYIDLIMSKYLITFFHFIFPKNVSQWKDYLLGLLVSNVIFEKKKTTETHTRNKGNVMKMLRPICAPWT